MAQAFPAGVGSPDFTIDPTALCDAAADVTACPINAPDLWGCDEAQQPAALTEANDQIVGPATAQLATALNLEFPALAGQAYPIAMTCNYNHFTQNPALPTSSTSASATSAFQEQARERFTYAISAGDHALCTSENWRSYWSIVLNSLHYVQDAAAEQHQIGNRWCAPAGPFEPGAAIGVVPRLAKAAFLAGLGATGRVVDDSCSDFLVSSLASAAIAGDLSGDAAVTRAGVAALAGLCLTQSIPAACMGLERLVRHHCDYQDGRSRPRAVACAGALSPDCEDVAATCSHPPATTYCEGELCLGGGSVDYVAAATTSSVPYLAAMASEWANACGCGATGIPCGAGAVCLKCGSVESCEAAGSQCCGNAVCGADQGCCAAAGPGCVGAGRCCGGAVCTSSEACLDCARDAGTPDAGAPDAGPADAGAGCGPGAPPPAPDGGTSVVMRAGDCVPAGTQCCDDELCPLGCCPNYLGCATDHGTCCQPPALPHGGHGGCITDADCCAPGKCIGGGCAIPYGDACGSGPQCFQNDGLGSATNSQCSGGVCCASHENTDCTSDSDCCPNPLGMKCNVSGGVGACYVPTNGDCTVDADCGWHLGFVSCTSGKCCWPAGVICSGGAAQCCSGKCGTGGYCQ